MPDEFKPSYASVVLGDLEAKVARVEQGPLLPCVTAWCSRCRAPYLLTSALALFPCPSAHHAHMVALAQRLGYFEGVGPVFKLASAIATLFLK